MGIINIFRIFNLQFNQLTINTLLMIVIVILLVTSTILFIVKTVVALKKEGEIDGRLRETRARISRVVTEIEDNKDSIPKVEIILTTTPEEALIDHVKQNIEDEPVPCIEEISKVTPKGKKTRAMAMEDRWAEYDKKRSMKNTA